MTNANPIRRPVNPTHILTDLFANWFSLDVAELSAGDKRGYALDG